MAVYYKGLAYPFKQSDTAFPAPVTNEQLVRESLLQILQTTRGERVMRPAFGCDLQRYVFENNDELLGQLLRTEVANAIARWEPRARLDDIQFERNDTALVVTITYTQVTTQTQDTLQVAVPANTGG